MAGIEEEEGRTNQSFLDRGARLSENGTSTQVTKSTKCRNGNIILQCHFFMLHEKDNNQCIFEIGRPEIAGEI